MTVPYSILFRLVQNNSTTIQPKTTSKILFLYALTCTSCFSSRKLIKKEKNERIVYHSTSAIVKQTPFSIQRSVSLNSEKTWYCTPVKGIYNWNSIRGNPHLWSNCTSGKAFRIGVLQYWWHCIQIARFWAHVQYCASEKGIYNPKSICCKAPRLYCTNIGRGVVLRAREYFSTIQIVLVVLHLTGIARIQAQVQYSQYSVLAFIRKISLIPRVLVVLHRSRCAREYQWYSNSVVLLRSRRRSGSSGIARQRMPPDPQSGSSCAQPQRFFWLYICHYFYISRQKCAPFGKYCTMSPPSPRYSSTVLSIFCQLHIFDSFWRFWLLNISGLANALGFHCLVHLSTFWRVSSQSHH